MANSSGSSSSSSGIGFFGLLAVVFITMKLMGWGAVANWSWWWVLAPLWGPITVLLVIGLIALIIAAIFG